MAQAVSIKAVNDVLEITVDGHVMEDVISYDLHEDSAGARLTLELYVSSAEVQR